MRPNGKPMLTAKYKIDAEGANRVPRTKIRVCEAVDIDKQVALKELKESLEPRVVKDMIEALSSDEAPKEAVLAKMLKLQTCIELLINSPECRDAVAAAQRSMGDATETLPLKDQEGGGKNVSFQ